MNAFLMNEIELPLIPIVADMEAAGYGIDVAHFNALREKLKPEIAQVLDQIRKVAGQEFNPNSPKQLQTLLFTKLGLKSSRKTKSGQPSTDDGTLQALRKEHEVISHLLRFRQLEKLTSTYCTIPDKVDSDGRLRVEFNQLAAETGRFSSSSIIQTIPKDDELGIREGFRAAADHKIVGADFKQQELLILAQVSGDRHMIAAINAKTDLHGLAAKKVFNLECEPNEVEHLHADKRRQIKEIQFGLIYGSTAYGLAPKIGGTKEDAEKLIRDYFQQFPAVQQLINKVHTDVVRDGFVDDVFGRRRYFPDAQTSIPRKSWQQMTDVERKLVNSISAAKRAAQNFVIQAAAATVTKLAMIRCHQYIMTNMPAVRMILTLHDELHFEVPDDQVDEFVTALPALMCDLGLERFGFTVPFSVDIKVGDTWGGMRRWGEIAKELAGVQ